MKIGGHESKPDLAKLGTSLLIAAAVIVAVRTARWSTRREDTTSQRDLEDEITHGVFVAGRILGHLLTHKGELFTQQQVAWWLPTEEDEAK